MSYDIKDITLAEQGENRITWAAQHMPVLVYQYHPSISSP